jgi:hypothetical protein
MTDDEIIEIAKQAGLFTHKEVQPEIKAFAALVTKLVVQECIDKCEFVANMVTLTNGGEVARKTKATANSCAAMIKEHFGVEL